MATLALIALALIAGWRWGSFWLRLFGLTLFMGSLWSLSGRGPDLELPWFMLASGLAIWLAGHALHYGRYGWWRSLVAARILRRLGAPFRALRVRRQAARARPDGY